MATDNDIVHTAAEALVIFSNRDHSAAGPSSAVPSCSTAPSQPCSSLQSAKEDDPMVCSIMLPDDLKQNLECPVCTRISLPPIMQCRNGHVTCNQCRLKVQSCPMCREVDIDIRYNYTGVDNVQRKTQQTEIAHIILYLSSRNLFAEKAVTFMSIPCEFKTYGCRVEIQYKDKELVSTLFPRI